MTSPDSHSVLKACTKVPLYNTCVTKINKHSPLAVSAPKEEVMQGLAYVPFCSPSPLPPSLSPAQDRTPPTGSHVVPVAVRLEGARPYQLWKHCLPFGFFILISRFLGQQPRELMHKLHETKVLSGRGWADPFTRNAMPLTSPLAGSHRKKGRWGYRLLLQEHGLYK